MEQTNELQKALQELKRITGISLNVTVDSLEDAKQACDQIHCLCTAYKEKYNKTDFLQSLLTGSIPSYDIPERAARLHVENCEQRVLFLMESNGFDETSKEILKHMFPLQTKTYLIPVTDTVMAILRPIRSEESFDDMKQIADTIVDTLNTEALIRVRISYSSIAETLFELSRTFQETSLALKVGRLFHFDQTVFPYNKLGVGRLIYQLPVSLCENFLKEIYGANIPTSFDPELIAMITRFFQNNLNIAETSRQMHMHRNTLIYRLEQIEKQTGLDLRNFEDAMTFKIAMMVMNYLNTNKTHRKE